MMVPFRLFVCDGETPSDRAQTCCALRVSVSGWLVVLPAIVFVVHVSPKFIRYEFSPCSLWLLVLGSVMFLRLGNTRPANR